MQYFTDIYQYIMMTVICSHVYIRARLAQNVILDWSLMWVASYILIHLLSTEISRLNIPSLQLQMVLNWCWLARRSPGKCNWEVVLNCKVPCYM